MPSPKQRMFSGSLFAPNHAAAASGNDTPQSCRHHTIANPIKPYLMMKTKGTPPDAVCQIVPVSKQPDEQAT